MPNLSVLRHYVTGSGPIVMFRVPAWHWAWRGLVLAIVLPFLLGILALIFGVAQTDDEDVFHLIVIGVVMGIGFIAGLTILALSPVLSGRTRCTVDWSRGELSSAREPYPVPLSSITQFRLGRYGSLSAFTRIEAVRAAGPPVIVLGPLTGRHTNDARLLIEWLATSARVPAETLPLGATHDTFSGGNPGLGGVLCYLPIQGIFLIASMYYLIAAPPRSFVRFCAIQSLSQFGCSIVVLGALLGVLGVPVALIADSPLRVVLIVVLALALTGFACWNIGAHIYACYAAYKQRLWVMPWLGFWVRRFLPPSPDANAAPPGYRPG